MTPAQRYRLRYPERVREAQRRYRAAHRDRLQATAARRRSTGQGKIATEKYRRKMRRFLAWLKETPCADCGRTFPKAAMDFDHRPESVKRITPAYLVNRALPFVQRELLGCDVVCAVCHRLRTESRRAA